MTLDRTLDTLQRRLLERRTPDGHWEGRLASSALSTATAIVALKSTGSPDLQPLVARGAQWLMDHQNEDGGWGDTVISLSNLSTTLLAWSSLSFCGKSNERAERWLRTNIGDVTPQCIRAGILERYGKDRTFSVPILSVLALTGMLGPGERGWRFVPQLPFELAACPHRWFQWLQLPVVSYALPALVAIGQSRHHQAPTRNPILRAVRSSLRRSTLTRTRRMQPESGGFLEATPLTAFVVMNLIHAGARMNSLVANGLRFLAHSMRDDGSWPIDTNLATWVTTLALNALGRHADAGIVDWLLRQQFTREHPFTHAKPGGWAWTDLSGGVPDADDTSGALLALWTLRKDKDLDAATSGIEWLLDLQNRDGGIPTFCRGWGALPFDRSAPDLTAHALEAWSAWLPSLNDSLQRRVSRAIERAVSYLSREQHRDGSWVPMWFGSPHAPGEINLTYGTARVVEGLAGQPAGKSARERGIAWLLEAQNPHGGWGGGERTPASIEETAIATAALAQDAPDAAMRGAEWLIAATNEGRETPPSPIGFYFAKLWYYEELYPLIFTLRALSRVVAPSSSRRPEPS